MAGYARMPSPVDAVVVDVDGTLVDTVYEHTVAWSRAFQDVGIAVPSYALHRVIGMDGHRLVAHVAGHSVEQAVGDRVREIHDTEYERLSVRLRLLPGADRLVGELKRRGHRVIVASSGSKRATDRALDLVPDAALADAVLSGADVPRGKPSPDLLDAALARVGGDRAALIGDSVWDALAGRHRGHVVIGVLTGGFTEAALIDAGADAVHASLEALIDQLDDTVLARSAAVL